MLASGVWTGCEYIANMYRVWSNCVCQLREGWLYRVHQEVGLWCAEDGREQFYPKSSTQVQRKILFFDYVRYASQRNKSMSVVWIYRRSVVCSTTTFVHGGVHSTIVFVRDFFYYCVEDFWSTDQLHVRWVVCQKSRYYCLGGLDSFRHLWPGWTYFRHLCGRYY